MKRSSVLIVIGFLVLVLLIAHYPALFSGFQEIQHDEIDSRLNHFILEHGYQWLIGKRESYWNGNYFYPAQGTLALGDTLLGVLPFYALIRILGIPVDLSFQLWLMFMSALNFLVAFVVLQKVTSKSPLACSIGAAFFAVASPRLSQMGHAQLIPHFYTVLCLYCIYLSFTARSHLRTRTAILGAAFFAALQFLSSPYLGWFLLFSIALGTLIALCNSATRIPLLGILSTYPITVIGVGILTLSMLYPVVALYKAVAGELGYRPFQEVAFTLPSLKLWIYQGPTSLLYGSLSSLKTFQTLLMEHELRIGFGLVTSLLALYGFYSFRSFVPLRMLTLTGIGIFVVITDFPGSLYLWDYLYLYVPGAGAIRAVARFALLLTIPVAMVLPFIVERILQNGRRLLLALLTTIIFLEQIHTLYHYNRARARMNVEFLVTNTEKYEEICKAFYFSQLKGRFRPEQYQVDAMWTSLVTGMPTVNGYSGNTPKGWKLAANSISSEEQESQTALALSDWAKNHHLDANTLCWLQKDLKQEVERIRVPEPLSHSQVDRPL